MRCRNTMILVLLVVWLLLGWVRSQRDAPTQSDRERRAHLRRRMLERLALRGYEARERERLAEDLLARLENHLASSSSPPPPPRNQREQHPSFQKQTSSRIFQEASYPEISPYEQVYPQLKILQGIESQIEEEPDYERVSLELEETKDVLRQYLIREFPPDKTMERRHVDEEFLPEVTTRRPSREERRRLKEERAKKKAEKKRKRANKKNKQRKKDREFELFLQNQSIAILDIEGDKFFDCCPSKLIVAPIDVGKDHENLAMEVHENHRAFYERVCLEEYLGKECIFPAKSLRKGVVTRCAQEWSYSQAYIRQYENYSAPYMMGHVKVRSGCSCQVSLTHKKKRKRKR